MQPATAQSSKPFCTGQDLVMLHFRSSEIKVPYCGRVQSKSGGRGWGQVCGTHPVALLRTPQIRAQNGPLVGCWSPTCVLWKFLVGRCAMFAELFDSSRATFPWSLHLLSPNYFHRICLYMRQNAFLAWSRSISGHWFVNGLPCVKLIIIPRSCYFLNLSNINF